MQSRLLQVQNDQIRQILETYRRHAPCISFGQAGKEEIEMTFNPKTRELVTPIRRKILSAAEVFEAVAEGIVCACHSKSCEPCVVRDTLKRESK